MFYVFIVRKDRHTLKMFLVDRRQNKIIKPRFTEQIKIASHTIE